VSRACQLGWHGRGRPPTPATATLLCRLPATRPLKLHCVPNDPMHA
jgi:hypothetical protein